MQLIMHGEGSFYRAYSNPLAFQLHNFVFLLKKEERTKEV